MISRTELKKIAHTLSCCYRQECADCGYSDRHGSMTGDCFEIFRDAGSAIMEMATMWVDIRAVSEWLADTGMVPVLSHEELVDAWEKWIRRMIKEYADVAEGGSK